MALIVEDGTIVTDAESYLSVADADTIIDERGGNSKWDALTTAQKEVQLRLSTEYLDSNYNFVGDMVEYTQPLSWPRSGLDRYASNEIPDDVKKALAVLSYQSIDNPLYTIESVDNGAIKSEMSKLDVLETKVEYYSGGSGISQTVFNEVRNILKRVLKGSSIGRA